MNRLLFCRVDIQDEFEAPILNCVNRVHLIFCQKDRFIRVGAIEWMAAIATA